MKCHWLVCILVLLSGTVSAQDGRLASVRMRLPRLQSAVMLPSRQHLAKSDFNGLSADPSVFAVPIETDFNPCNSGEWFSADGSKVWRIALCSPNAYSLNVALSDFYIPNGAELFVYDSDKKLVLGAFTSEQNTDWLQ